MLIVNLFDKNIEWYLLDLLTRNKIKDDILNIYDTLVWLIVIESLLFEDIASYIVILCYVWIKIKNVQNTS